VQDRLNSLFGAYSSDGPCFHASSGILRLASQLASYVQPRSCQSHAQRVLRPAFARIIRHDSRCICPFYWPPFVIVSVSWRTCIRVLGALDQDSAATSSFWKACSKVTHSSNKKMIHRPAAFAQSCASCPTSTSRTITSHTIRAVNLSRKHSNSSLDRAQHTCTCCSAFSHRRLCQQLSRCVYLELRKPKGCWIGLQHSTYRKLNHITSFFGTFDDSPHC